MAETKCYVGNQLLDLVQIQQEAKHRWLRPAEICEILTNYQKFQLSCSPPTMPPGGSLFLYDRKVLRYFRKDGHRWRKKIDGKSVNEAHEKLKAGSVDVLHCYYAHGEDNENFQRRSYRMLDKRFENIVLVHYREVKEGYKSGFPRDSATLLQSCDQASYNSDLNSVDRNQQSVSSSRLNDSEDVETSLTNDTDTAGYLNELFGVDDYSSAWTNLHGTITADFLSEKLTGAARLDAEFPNSPEVLETGIFANVVNHSAVENGENGGLKKLDSFGRWMDKEMGGDCEGLSDSTNYWNAIGETENDKDEISSLSHHMQLNMNTDSVGPSLSKEQLFSICDFAPDWAYSGTETKVLITGSFLGDKKQTSDIKWCCMFGEIEVPAEVISQNAIRCNVPFHEAGRVPFYITCSNRLACSEVREFEYIKKPSSSSSEDEFSLLARFSKLLSSSSSSRTQRPWFGCVVENCEKCCKSKGALNTLIVSDEDKERSWKRIGEVFKGNCKELLIQSLLKDKLYEELLFEAHKEGENEKGLLRKLDEKGSSVIHLAAALGYNWAIIPIINGGGLNPNYRDTRGRSALHYASLYGREETVVTLIKLGAFAGAVDDPTPLNPGGQTPADVASSKGHKGIAGYLAEVDLTSHLLGLSVSDSSNNNNDSNNGVISEAVRRSAHAAARIHDAFRVRSFRQRQEVSTRVNDLDEENDVFSLPSVHNKVHKTGGGHYEDYLHLQWAASRIQHKYRGFKGRNDFLKIRDRIVKIQAHFRGHKVRKHYKKVVWSVGIVEKAILRWRRKSRGLRGFRPELVRPAGEGEYEYDHLQMGRRQKSAGVEKALARVHSMARHPQAQHQYMRLLLNSQKLSHEDSSSSRSE